MAGHTEEERHLVLTETANETGWNGSLVREIIEMKGSGVALQVLLLSA